jgi:hypothetical protein
MGAAEIFLNKEIAEFTARHSRSQLAPVVVLVLEEFWVATIWGGFDFADRC